MQEIKLTQGYQTIVDDDDFQELSKFKWFAWKVTGGNIYAARHIDKNKIVKMQNYLMNPPAGRIVDHINGDSLDNRKENLRICTQAENNRNSRIRKDNKSGFKGVHLRKKIDGSLVYTVMIGAGEENGKQKNAYMGCYESARTAAKIYDMAAVMLWGHYAWLNDPKNFIPGLKLRYEITGKYWTE